VPDLDEFFFKNNSLPDPHASEPSPVPKYRYDIFFIRRLYLLCGWWLLSFESFSLLAGLALSTGWWLTAAAASLDLPRRL
jgi:hypothetical protein